MQAALIASVVIACGGQPPKADNRELDLRREEFAAYLRDVRAAQPTFIAASKAFNQAIAVLSSSPAVLSSPPPHRVVPFMERSQRLWENYVILLDLAMPPRGLESAHTSITGIAARHEQLSRAWLNAIETRTRESIKWLSGRIEPAYDYGKMRSRWRLAVKAYARKLRVTYPGWVDTFGRPDPGGNFFM